MSVPTAEDIHNRRSFLRHASLGIGPAALVSFLRNETIASGLSQGNLSQPHHPPRVKRVVHLCMAGGPSHLETFDEKTNASSDARKADA